MAPTSLLVLFACITTSQGAEPLPDSNARISGSSAQHLAAPKVLKLERQSVMLPKTAVRAGRRKNFYSAKIKVGEPAQEFHMTFDLGGATTILPSQMCTDEACLERRRYDRLISNKAEDINANGQLVEPTKPKTFLQRRDRGTLGMHSIDVGSGKVTGTFVRDQICIQGVTSDGSEDKEPRCFPLAMLTANKMTDMPFDVEPYDGAIGLGLSGMSISREFNFLAAFHTGYRTWLGQRSLFPNSFGLHIASDGDGGEITLGGYDDRRLTHPLKWAPVADPEDGRWQVAITAIRMGNKTIEACSDRACRAAIDYSSSLLAVPSKLATGIEDVLAKLAPRAGFGDGCQHLAIPDLHLELKDGVTLTLPAEDWVSEFGVATDALSCKPLLSHHRDDDDYWKTGQDLFVLGESTLRRYYTFFNADTLSVGFSLAAGSLDKNDKGTLALPSGKKDGKKGKEALDGENPVILLVQVKIKRSKTVSSLS